VKAGAYFIFTFWLIYVFLELWTLSIRKKKHILITGILIFILLAIIIFVPRDYDLINWLIFIVFFIIYLLLLYALNVLLKKIIWEKKLFKKILLILLWLFDFSILCLLLVFITATSWPFIAIYFMIFYLINDKLANIIISLLPLFYFILLFSVTFVSILFIIETLHWVSYYRYGFFLFIILLFLSFLIFIKLFKIIKTEIKQSRGRLKARNI